MLIDLNDELGETLASELSGLYVRADVSDADQVQAAVDAAAEVRRCGRRSGSTAVSGCLDRGH